MFKCRKQNYDVVLLVLGNQVMCILNFEEYKINETYNGIKYKLKLFLVKNN